MLTKDVRVDPRLNEYLWSQGIRNLPRKVRVRLSRKKKEEDDGKGKFYTFVQHVDVESFAELKTERVKNSD